MSFNSTLRIDILGRPEFARRIHGLIDRIEDPRPFFREFATAYAELLQRRMDAEGAVDGEPRWAELTPRYAAAKARLLARSAGAGPNKILQLTGRMYKAVTQPTVDITSSRLTITIDSPYAIYHQTGTVKMVARPIANFTGKFKARVMRIWRESIIDAAKS